MNFSVGQSEFINALRGIRAGQPDNAFQKQWNHENIQTYLSKARPQTAIHQRNQTQMAYATQIEPVLEKTAPVRPVSVQGSRRVGFKGNKFSSGHQRVKSAAPGGRNMTQASSVAEFVAASSNPRGGVWASKSYKTPYQFVPNLYKVRTHTSKQPKVNILEQEAKKKQDIPAPNKYIKCLDWKKENKEINF